MEIVEKIIISFWYYFKTGRDLPITSGCGFLKFIITMFFFTILKNSSIKVLLHFCSKKNCRFLILICVCGGGKCFLARSEIFFFQLFKKEFCCSMEVKMYIKIVLLLVHLVILIQCSICSQHTEVHLVFFSKKASIFLERGL